MKALIIAFSMYSKIPMPMFQWEEKDRRAAMCFFPLVGAVVGILFFGGFCLLDALQTGPVLKGALLAAVPLLATGGIHMDGFLDTCDARASYGDRERKLEILKDSHTGAFAIIWGVLYLLLLAGVYSESDLRSATVLAASFMLSRALSGLAVSLLPGARERGMLADLTKDSNRTATAWAMGAYIVISVGAMVWLKPAAGAAAALMAFGVWVYYCRMARKEFGGVTGDLAGYFLQICELAMALAVVIGTYI